MPLTSELVSSEVLLDMQRQVDAARRKNHAEPVALGSVLIPEESDRTAARIYKPLSRDHRERLLALLSEIDRAST